MLGAGLGPVTGVRFGGAYARQQSLARRGAVIPSEEAHRESRTPVSGFDLTFSPPKSLSTLWGVADAGIQLLLAQAHHAALADTLTLLEERVASTRVGHGGVARLGVRGVVAVAFDHHDSRAGDPQLHCRPGMFPSGSYRQRHGITGPAPLGKPKDIRGPKQADEYRTAGSALDRARQLSNQSHNQGPTRRNLPIDLRHRVDF